MTCSFTRGGARVLLPPIVLDPPGFSYQEVRFAIELIDDRLRGLYDAHYLHGCSFANIGRAMRLSKTRVAQLHQNLLSAVAKELGVLRLSLKIRERVRERRRVAWRAKHPQHSFRKSKPSKPWAPSFPPGCYDKRVTHPDGSSEYWSGRTMVFYSYPPAIVAQVMRRQGSERDAAEAASLGRLRVENWGQR